MAKLKIHTENILPIIKKWLYSDKEIFLRELVANACDALEKVRILKEHHEVSLSEEELKISILVDPKARTLKIIDTGIGMTAEEVEKYIAQVAFSGAEEFLGKYKTNDEKDQIIGHFGLGFYSAYMVAEKVTIETLSYTEGAESALWECDGSSDYTLQAGKRSTRGCEITLYIDKENDEFLEVSRLREILEKYCRFLPFPIALNESVINAEPPLWLKPASECSDKEYLDFFHTLYPFEADPLFWVHLNVDYPFHVKGILYFPKITRRFDWTQNSVKLFCNRVFVSDNCKDLLPEYLMVLKGALESSDIPLNVSRSTLQMDRTVRQLSAHISKKVADRLSALYQTDREKFLETWTDSEVILKLGALQDEKFYERVKDFLVWKNSTGTWTNAEEYLQRNSKNKIFYTIDENSPLLKVYKDKNIEVLIANGHIDNAVMNFLEGKLNPAKFQRIDGAVDETLLDASKEKTLLDAEGKTEASRIADFIRETLALEKLSVEAKSLTSEALPAFIVLDEETRRLRDTFALSGQTLPPSLTEKRTLVVNTNNSLVASLSRLKNSDPELAKEMVLHVYDLSLLSQKELEAGKLTQFIDRTSRLLEKLVKLN
jgi:molecular chaperone HtpG